MPSNDSSPGGCGAPRSQQAEITIDGQSGRIAECPNQIEATVIAGGRLYLFTLSHDRSDARAVFDAFAATIDLTPETAVDFPGLTTTFVSPTYGFSFKYFDRGGPRTGHGALGSRQPAARRRARPGRRPIRCRGDRLGRLSSRARRHRSRTGSRSMSGSTMLSSRYRPAAAMCLAASRRRSPSMGSRAGSRSVRTRSRRPSSPAGGSISSSSRHDRSDARAFFDTWVATIDLRPEDAAAPSSTPSEAP